MLSFRVRVLIPTPLPQRSISGLLSGVPEAQQSHWSQRRRQPGIHLWQPHDNWGAHILCVLMIFPWQWNEPSANTGSDNSCRVAFAWMCLCLPPHLDTHNVLLASVRLRVAGIFVSISTKCLKEGKVMWDRLVNVPLDQGARNGRLPKTDLLC